MYRKKIFIAGSSNTDMVITSHKLPLPGETIMGGNFFMNPGGKGANQAVAAARLGGEVIFVAKTGNDIFGKQAKLLFENEGIKTDYILTDAKHPSGVALIMVDSSAENCISVAPGANNHLLFEDIKSALKEIDHSDVVLLQLEIPLSTVEEVASYAKEKGKMVILNPAPAQILNNTLLKNISILTPNETEAELLTGIKIQDKASAEKAANILHEKGVEIVIITMGAMGAFLSDGKQTSVIAAPKVVPVDTTAAGDTFNGALAVSLSEGMELSQAISFANKAAAISVTRLGAQTSIPHRNEIGL